MTLLLGTDHCAVPRNGSRLFHQRRDSHGKAVHVDPMKPTLKAHGTKRLTLTFNKLLSNIAFKSNLRRYTMDDERLTEHLVSSATVRRSRLTLSTHVESAWN
jgi:hypothetical protein